MIHKLIETKPRKAKFGFRGSLDLWGSDLVKLAEEARSIATMCDLIHEVMGAESDADWWIETPNNAGSVSILLYINDVNRYERMKAALDTL